ncbi:Zn(II)2Cys6 transcription factor [Aspergillus foveolatus]|uniref:Zn(II)2Cys6 transcription factor n=1 Tax=Aspergillus foveolatus TaxID=210207 RepID=UPI003CCD3A57
MTTLRRNGRLSSCEPCRKAKLRCDHQSPVCGRCLSNGHSGRCFYHPAPLTQPRAQSSRLTDTSRRPRRQRRPDNQLVFRLDPRISSTPSEEEKILCDQTEKEKRTLQPGPLGLVSPQDIFSEYEVTIATTEPGCSSAATAKVTAPRDQILRGAQILSHLQKIRWFQEVIDLKDKTSPGWFLGPPMTRALCNSMEKMYNAAVCGSEDTNASLIALSRQIFSNTSAEIRVHSAMDLYEYLDLIAARWETVGLFFALLGTALFHTADDDPIFTHWNPWKLAKDQLRSMAITVGGLCCQFCNSAGKTSDPFCWLMIQHIVLLTEMFGDSDYRVWQTLGDLSTTIYGFGLHQFDQDLEESFPFFLLEIRKRVMVCAYAIDKELATSLGRPPRICSRYCHLPMPLDLTYNEILAQPNKEEALLTLGADGWNSEGNLTVGVRLRIALLTSLLRESILELSLSPGTQHIQARAERLIQQSRHTQQGLPSFLRWPPEDAAACVNDSANDEARAFAHIEFTYQEFLLHRILLKRLGIKGQGLIESSLEIITTLSSIIAMQTRSGKRAINMSWDLCYMGLPAAGILTSQLLSERSMQALSPMPALTLPANFRSVTIQKLSVFVSHLTTLIQPHEGNFKVAQNGANFIRWVLDQALTLDATKNGSQTADACTGLSEPWFDDRNMTVDFDFMAWCDDINWPQDHLLSLT